ncbi:hypothetical protein L1887_63197 [Cichorium endivia]|nr:hypothetical protein L1887_63197 [Cichorium endivia]
MIGKVSIPLAERVRAWQRLPGANRRDAPCKATVPCLRCKFAWNEARLEDAFCLVQRVRLGGEEGGALMAPTFLGGAWLSALCTLRCQKTGLRGPKFSTGPPGLSGLPTAAHFPAQSECVRPAALAWLGSRQRADLPVVGGCSAGLVASEKKLLRQFHRFEAR